MTLGAPVGHCSIYAGLTAEGLHIGVSESLEYSPGLCKVPLRPLRSDR